MESEPPSIAPSPRFSGLQVKAIVSAGLYLLLLAYYHSFSDYGFNLWDEGGFANGTLRTLHGEQALKDFNPNGYLPGRYLYAALFFKSFGIDIQSLRTAVLLFTPAMVLMVYAIARRCMPAGFALLAAVCMLSVPSMYYNRFFTFFTVATLYSLIRAIEKNRLPHWLLLLAIILLSAFFKIEITCIALLVSACACAWLFLEARTQGKNAASPETPTPPLTSDPQLDLTGPDRRAGRRLCRPDVLFL